MSAGFRLAVLLVAAAPPALGQYRASTSPELGQTQTQTLQPVESGFINSVTGSQPGAFTGFSAPTLAERAPAPGSSQADKPPAAAQNADVKVLPVPERPKPPEKKKEEPKSPPSMPSGGGGGGGGGGEQGGGGGGGGGGAGEGSPVPGGGGILGAGNSGSTLVAMPNGSIFNSATGMFLDVGTDGKPRDTGTGERTSSSPAAP